MNYMSKSVSVARTIAADEASGAKSYRLLAGVSVLLAGFLLFAAFFVPKANAETVLLDGIITDGEFLSPQFIPNPNLPGGGSIMNVDQLGLTGTNIAIALEFSQAVLGDSIMDGYSFLSLDGSGQVIGSNVSLTGTLGDPSLGGLTFASEILNAGERVAIENGVFRLDVFATGRSDGPRSLAIAPGQLLSLMSAPLPMSVQTVADLVEFLNMTETFTSGSLPVEFFTSNGTGETTLVSTDITFEVNASDELPSVPLPAAAWIFLTGLGGLGAWTRRKSRSL